MSPEALPYGTWPSPLSPAVLSAARVSIGGLWAGEDSLWWSESRPTDGGRMVVVRSSVGSAPVDVSPSGVSVRTKVHEYGGASFCLHGESLVYVSYDDQALWALSPGASPTRLTESPPAGEEHRYGDPWPVPDAPWLVAVRERHHDGFVDDEVVAVPIDGRSAPKLLVSGDDFYAGARPSPDGSRLAWMSWNHPDMPWDSSTVWVGELALERDGLVLGEPVAVAGGRDESVGQPTWGVHGTETWLYFVSDRTGWWQPYRWRADADDVVLQQLNAAEAEFHAPDWVLGQSTLVPQRDGTLVCRVRHGGRDQLVVLAPSSDGAAAEDASWLVVQQPCVSIAAVLGLPDGSGVAVVGATPELTAGIHRVTFGTRTVTALVHQPVPPPLGPDAVTVAQELVLPAEGDDRPAIPLLFYSPRPPSADMAPVGPPPLVVVCHGGPTAAAEPGLDLGVQQWTTRGVAVAVVDYRGSSGHGRHFRQALHGLWGVADAEDCVTAARWLAQTGRVDGDRMVVKGTSAGGFTALRCLHAGGPFRAAVVGYGVTDLRALARDTHKFESHYLDRLVGPWPDADAVYQDRSPALHPDRIDGAVLLLQGDADPVVPPNQATDLADALGVRGMRCELVVFEGEGHGFRRADTLARAAELELRFVGSVLGFEPAVGDAREAGQ